MVKRIIKTLSLGEVFLIRCTEIKRRKSAKEPSYCEPNNSGEFNILENGNECDFARKSFMEHTCCFSKTFDVAFT